MNQLSKSVKNAIENYQCAGCVNGPALTCYLKNNSFGLQCDQHAPGTIIMPIVGRVFMGLPTGFNRIGDSKNCTVHIFESFTEDQYNMYNVPVWKHLNKKGHTLVRVYVPRLNHSRVEIFLENCLDKISCEEISLSQIKAMD